MNPQGISGAEDQAIGRLGHVANTTNQSSRVSSKKIIGGTIGRATLHRNLLQTKARTNSDETRL
jgi:hypothetical protein